MKKESPSSIETQIDKDGLRLILKEKRNALSPQRRIEASLALSKDLLPLLKPYKAILSFYSLPQEIDLCVVNQELAKEGKLHLPKVHGKNLRTYRVNHLETLLLSKWNILEPNPLLCSQSGLHRIDCVLVPGLGFDANHRRIGYGRGHYDRLLAKLSRTLTMGIGFKEQYCENSLPCEDHDVALQKVLLY